MSVHSGRVYDWFKDKYFLRADSYECLMCWQLVRPAESVSHIEDHLDALDAEDVDREIKERPTLREEAEP